jgi:chromate transporter
LREFTQQTLIWGGLWLLPLLGLFFAFGGAHVFVQEAAFFSKLAAVTFGGAYAALSYTAQQAVEHFGWMKPGEMLTGLGLAETTPGPLILVLVFVGFVGAANLSGLPPLLGGLFGGLIALWFTFVPCFLWILAGAPFVERLRQVRRLSRRLSVPSHCRCRSGAQ